MRKNSLRGDGLFTSGANVHAAAVLIETNVTIFQSEQGVIISLTDGFSSVVFVTNLTNNDISSFRKLTGEKFDSTTLRVGITTVTATALTFLMCHNKHSCENDLI